MENPARTGSVMQRDVWARWPRSGYTPWEARGGVLPRPDLGTASRHDEGFFPRRLRGCPFPCRWPERAACLLTLSRSLEAAPGTGRTLGTVLREPLSAAGNQTLREGSLSSRKRVGVGVGGAGGLVGGISRTPGLPLPHPASLRVPPGVTGWPPHSHSPGQGGRAGSPPCLTLSSGREPGWGSWGLL